MAEVCVSAQRSAGSQRVRLLQSNARRVGANWVHKQMNLPCERGPDGRYDFESLLEREGTASAKFNPLAFPPAGNAPLAPLRDEVLLIDPCSGHLSAGAEVDLKTKGRRAFIDFEHVSSGLWVPPYSRERPQTPRLRPSAVRCDWSEEKAWNSRRIPDSAVRAGLGGWTSHKKVRPASHKVPCSVKFYSFFPERETGSSDVGSSAPAQWIYKAARRFIYTSMAQRGYEDVGWDTKLPRRPEPPATTLEKMADPVNQHFTQKRYHGKPELWQRVGAQWSRHQLRAQNEVRKPISFSSPCSKSGQIPLYSGVVGSVNMDDIDDTGRDFYPLTVLRTTVPPYTPTAHRPTIPGYAGKAQHDHVHPTGFSLPALPSSARSLGAFQGPPGPAHGRTAPLSRMVTTVTPRNPFLHPERPAAPI